MTFPGPQVYPGPDTFPASPTSTIDNLTYMQYEIDGFKFGGDPNTNNTNFLVEKVDFADPDFVNQDTALPLEDGQIFGRDYKRGRTITFTINVITRNNLSALGPLSDLSAAWDNGNVRQTPGATSVLRWNRHGRASRVYGRTRKFAPVTGKVDQGWVPVLCDFKTVDQYYYSDQEFYNNVPLVPPPSGGWVMPFSFPVTPGGNSNNKGSILIGGTKPAWIVSIINGPIINPIVSIANQWSFQLQLALGSGEFVVVNPRPWSRYARLNGSTNIRNRFTQESSRLNRMIVPPGQQEFILSGIDPTGTSSLTVLWREARSSF